MYLPESKYSKPKYTPGEEFTLPNGTTYRGWYFIAYTGEIFTGKTPGNNNKALTPFPTLATDEGNSNRFVSEVIKPTENDYTEGKFIRYFLQDKRNKSIVEVSKGKFETMKQLRYLDSHQITWQLEGPAEDTKYGPYIYFGAASKNKETVENADKTISGLKNFIKSYAEFVK